MKIGVHIPQWGPEANRRDIIDMAQAAEELGFDSVWVADHIVFPADSATRYPYADALPFTAEEGILEPFTQLAVVAGATSRVELGTSVLVLPLRHPLYVAKIVATLEAMAPGRTQLAVGAGWWREEFEALDQRFEDRGRRMNEQIEIMNLAWTTNPFEYHGEFYDFGMTYCLPTPKTKPGILIGGLGAVALRRVRSHGDGWHVVGSDAEALAAQRAQLDAIGAGLVLSTSGGMSRDPERARARLQRVADAGVDQIALNSAQPVREFIACMQMYDREVLPALRGR